MDRFALEYLKTWKSKPNRKPLIIRGAREVGKTFPVSAREMRSLFLWGDKLENRSTLDHKKTLFHQSPNT